MKPITSVIALTLALALNAIAIAALNRAMTSAGELAQVEAVAEPVRIVVTAKKEAPAELAKAQCPGPKAL